MAESIEAEKIVLQVDVNDETSIEVFASKLKEIMTRLDDSGALHSRIGHSLLRQSICSFRALWSGQGSILNVFWFCFCFFTGMTLLSSSSPLIAVSRLAYTYSGISLRLLQGAMALLHEKFNDRFLSDVPLEGARFRECLHMIGNVLPRRTRIRVWTPAVEELVEDWALARSQFPKSFDRLKLKGIFYFRAFMLMLNCFGVSTASAISWALLWLLNKVWSALISSFTN